MRFTSLQSVQQCQILLLDLFLLLSHHSIYAYSVEKHEQDQSWPGHEALNVIQVIFFLKRVLVNDGASPNFIGKARSTFVEF